ncbi:MAG: YihY/virulence factor BrkB family protein [Spirochaetaceae bacterium]|jgi:membrane protein|nr:YihY/virulence factor BrkB family protein [Spirochaetaceae bacterium]
MKQSILEKIKKKLRPGIESVIQCALITIELFNKNGLANHAAAGAYGFLFSAAPALLIVSFFVSKVLESSPETAATLIGQMGLLGNAFDMRELSSVFFGASKPGFGGLVSIAGLLWTARVFALSLQRGLGIIFPPGDKPNPLKKMMVPAVLETAIILFTFIVVLSSESALLMYQVMGIFPAGLLGFVKILSSAVMLGSLGLLIFGAYLFTPEVPPKRKAAAGGTVFCLICDVLIFAGSRFIFNPAKYNIIYGTLGNLIILLADVYFFFTFFFLGGELTFIIHFFDPLLLARFIKSDAGQTKPSFDRRFFLSTVGTLKKYLQVYADGDVLFRKGDLSREVYYILRGTAGVYLEEATMVALIQPKNFFGEMGHLNEEGRSATIKAHGELRVLVMPPELFQEVLKQNTEADRKVIEMLSGRLRNVNEKLLTSDQAGGGTP